MRMSNRTTRGFLAPEKAPLKRQLAGFHLPMARTTKAFHFFTGVLVQASFVHEVETATDVFGG